MSGYRGRFAPSPTGPLHFGSLVAALGSWLDARHHSGTWLVRIEDIDPPRERAGAADGQLQTLQRLGLESDEPVMRQSERSEAYDSALASLREGGLLFECRCSRRDLASTGGAHFACVAHPSGARPALRFRPPESAPEFVDRRLGLQQTPAIDSMGDVVLKRADGLYAYQLAVVVDDAAQRITDVVRGADLLDSTARQIALQQALQLPTPRYLHLPLALDSDGRKLSKSLDTLQVDAQQPLASLCNAWRFLLPSQPEPSGTTVTAWLQKASHLYSPSALRAADAVPAGSVPVSGASIR